MKTYGKHSRNASSSDCRATGPRTRTSWILTQSQCTHLRAIQDKMLRMIYVPRYSHGNTGRTQDSVVQTTASLPEKHKILHYDETYFASYFSWCGHVARLTKADPKRETGQIFMLQNLEQLPNLKKELGSQCHGRRFRTNVAQDRMGWKAKMDAMIKWRKQKMVDRIANPIE